MSFLEKGLDVSLAPFSFDKFQLRLEPPAKHWYNSLRRLKEQEQIGTSGNNTQTGVQRKQSGTNPLFCLQSEPVKGLKNWAKTQ
jgi:hypothetical protein